MSKAIARIEELTLFFQKLNLILIILLLIIAIPTIIFKIRKRIENNRTELKKSTPTNAHGILFGKKGKRLIYSPTEQEGHVAVFGGSGLGKTSALLIPTLRSWTGSSFTIDISGDISSNVTMPNKMVYSPESRDSIPYNIFHAIDILPDENAQNEALEKIAYMLMPVNERMSDASKFYHTEGRKILTASLIAFYHQHWDFIEICEKIVFSSWKELFTAIDDTKYHKAIQYINSFIGTSEQNTSGCKQACDSVLKFFATNETVKYTIHRPRLLIGAYFSPDKLETHNVFVTINDSSLKLYAPLLNIISAQCLDYFSQRKTSSKHTILFSLDEFASLGNIDITDALRKLRKKNVRIMILTQSMPDIDLIYGRAERMAMLNNFKYKVLLGASDTDTQEYFAKLIGYKKSKRLSKTKSGWQTTYTESDDKDWIIEPASLGRLKKGSDTVAS